MTDKTSAGSSKTSADDHIAWFAEMVRRLDKGNYDDRIVLHIFQAKKILAQIGARSLAEVSNTDGRHQVSTLTDAGSSPAGRASPSDETNERRNQDERTLRRLLAFAYSGSALYGDDGELQDGRHPMIDYVRDSVADIERKIHERGMAKLAAAACPECRYVIGHKAGCSSEKAAAPRDPLLDGLCDHGLRIEDCERGCKKAYDMLPSEADRRTGTRNHE